MLNGKMPPALSILCQAFIQRLGVLNFRISKKNAWLISSMIYICESAINAMQFWQREVLGYGLPECQSIITVGMIVICYAPTYLGYGLKPVVLLSIGC